jgi:hypothetical protein
MMQLRLRWFQSNVFNLKSPEVQYDIAIDLGGGSRLEINHVAIPLSLAGQT